MGQARQKKAGPDQPDSPMGPTNPNLRQNGGLSPPGAGRYDCPMDILIATNNAHKLVEFREIFRDHRVLGPADLGLRFHHEETGTTFFDNSWGKARTLWEQALSVTGNGKDLPAVLADDSGIVVPALNGEPGVYSARYGSVPGGPELDDTGRCRLLLDRMAGENDRTAWFVCCMVLYAGPDRFSSVQETWKGHIAPGLSEGRGGFGYDPLFIPEGHDCSVADLEEGLKSRISHRARASADMARLLAT